jgi:hypothetical protein
MTTTQTEIGAEISGPGRRYYDDPVLDNLMESLLELTAAVWTYHDRTLVLESVLERLLAESHQRPDLNRLIEEHRVTPEERARRQAERDQLVTNVFRSFARRPTLDLVHPGASAPPEPAVRAAGSRS